jgi:hypothetical protein
MLFEDATYNKILHIENNLLPLLSDADQQRILSYRIAYDTGAVIPSDVVAQINRILATVAHTEHSSLGGVQTAPLSMAKVIRDLAGARLMLSPQERAFVDSVAPKIATRTPLSQPEMAALIRIYTDKGF